MDTWTIEGNVDPLYLDPSGLVWALQSNDGNSALTVINPTTNGTTSFPVPKFMYANVANRGFDGVEFRSGGAYLRGTNPTSSTDPP